MGRQGMTIPRTPLKRRGQGFVVFMALSLFLLKAFAFVVPLGVGLPLSLEHGARTAISVDLCDAGKQSSDEHSPTRGHHQRCLFCLASAHGVALDRAMTAAISVAFRLPREAMRFIWLRSDDQTTRRRGLSNSWASRAPPLFS